MILKSHYSHSSLQPIAHDLATIPTLGLEFEGSTSLPGGRKRIAKLLENHLTSLGHSEMILTEEKSLVDSEIVFLIGPNNSPTNRLESWVVENDTSIPNMVGREAIEIVSPIIRSLDELITAESVWSKFAEWDVTAHPESCGVHFHVGWPEMKPIEYVSLRILIEFLRQDLAQLFGISKARQLWLQPLEQEVDFLVEAERTFAHLKQTNGQSPLWFQFLLACNDPFNRTFNGKRSWLRMTKLKTLEFRILNSTTFFEGVIEARNLFMHIVYYSQFHMAEIFEALENGTRQISLQKVLEITGYPLDEKQASYERLRGTK